MRIPQVVRHACLLFAAAVLPSALPLAAEEAPRLFVVHHEISDPSRIADYEATADLINRMKKGQLLTVQAIHMNGQPMSPQLELKDFAKAYDGPPTDPKVFEAQQKKLQEELQKRAEDARKRLESQQPAPAK